MFLVRAHNPKVVSSKCDPRNRPPHSHAASEKLNSVVRVVQTGPPAPFLPSHFPIACVECRGSYGNRVRHARGGANRYIREAGSFVRGGERGEYLRNPDDAMLAQRVAAGELLKVAEAVHAPAS